MASIRRKKKLFPEIKTNIKSEFIGEEKYEMATVVTVHPDAPDDSLISHTSKKAKIPHLYSFMPMPTPGGDQKSSKDELEEIMKEYIQEYCLPFDTDPLVYWKVSPQRMLPLMKLARGVMGCSATSAPSERVFSITWNFYTANRTMLGPSTFQKLLLIKCNKEVFELQLNFGESW